MDPNKAFRQKGLITPEKVYIHCRACSFRTIVPLTVWKRQYNVLICPRCDCMGWWETITKEKFND